MSVFQEAIYGVRFFDEKREEGRVERRESIVRCRDCKEYNTVLYQHITCELLERYVKPNDFCSWGIKK